MLDRREFLLSTAAVAAAARWPLAGTLDAAAPAVQSPVPASVRADFPRATSGTYLNSAARHPLGVHVVRGMHRNLDYQTYGPGEGRASFGEADQLDLKARYGRLINATPDEIAFVQSTSDGENIVVSGLDLAAKGGNVVVDDLHFVTSLYMYKTLEATGVELRVVKQRDWKLHLDDYDRAIDRNTRLVSMALVSNVNGYPADAAGISRIAHDRGALVYADIIQAVGAVPLDIKALGIDFAAASTYKWLMAEMGFGLLYVRADLQGTVLPTTRYGHRQVRGFDREAITWEPLPGAARYETGNIAEPLAAATHTSLQYIEKLGLSNIVSHAQRLMGRIKTELPKLGYRSMTPDGVETPLAAFHLPDVDRAAARLRQANITVTIVPPEQRMRVSVSVFNNDEDLDRLVAALR